MTIEQQNIIKLLKSADLTSIEIAEQTAIATGNGKWFCRYINKYIVKILQIIKHSDLYVYGEYFDDVSEKQIKILFAIVAILGNVDYEGFDSGDDSGGWCDVAAHFVFDYSLKISFIPGNLTEISELEKLGIKFKTY